MSLFLKVPLFCGSTESLRDLPPVGNAPLPCLHTAVAPQMTKHSSLIQNEFVLKSHERVLKPPLNHERRLNSGILEELSPTCGPLLFQANREGGIE